MKTRFASFWNRNIAFYKLAVLSNLEYRINFITDALLSPVITSIIEAFLWYSVVRLTPDHQIAGMGWESYVSYVIWAAFVGRVTSNWMYEFRMINEIDSGAVNSILIRPISFFECYLSQLLGYKSTTLIFSFLIPFGLEFFWDSPVDLKKLPIVLCLIVYYLFFVHLMSFCLATFAFKFNKVHSFTVAKNVFLWTFSGELFPLDLAPPIVKNILILLPFSNAAYVPVAYLTGRIPIESVYTGFLSVTGGIVFLSLMAKYLWNSGIKSYTGTGA